MSHVTLSLAMLRIKASTPESPIAVLKSERPGHVNAVFASTVLTARKIDRGDEDVIGVFDGTMDLRRVEKQVRAAIERAA